MATLNGLFEHFGTAIVFVNALLRELGVPIPLAPTVMVAGATRSDVVALVTLVAVVVAGSLVGNGLWFAAGRRFGTSVVERLCRYSLSPDTCGALGAKAFERWGPALIVIGRFVPGVSLIAPPFAGALGMRWPKFLGLTALGSAIWTSVVLLAGRMLGRRLVASLDAVGNVPAELWLVGSIVVGGLVLWCVYQRSPPKVTCVTRDASNDIRAARVPFSMRAKGD